MIKSFSVEDYISSYDYIISFNKNSDHIRYLRFYREISKTPPVSEPFFFKKNILLTTVGVREFLFGIYAKSMGNRVTQVIHDYVPHPGKKSAFIMLYNKLASLFFRICFHSRSEAEKFKKSCDMFPLPITNINFRQTCSPDSYFLAFGRSESYKNFLYIEHLASYFPEKKFMICSKNFKSNSNYPNLLIKNTYLPEDELRILISNSLGVILPYTSATQSGVIVLAYELGVPVIASDEPGLVEYITPELGSVFSLESTESFIDAENKLISICEDTFLNKILEWNKSFIL